MTRLSRAVGPIVVAVLVQSAANLGLHAALGRLLTADAYGALGAVLAAMVLLGVPLGALQTAASALVAEHGPGRVSARRTLGRVALASVPPAAAVLACAPLLRDFFHLGSWADAAQLAPFLVASAVLAAARGLLLGARRVGAVAATYLIGTAVRLALGLALAVPFGVAGALLGTLAGEAVALAVAAGLLLSRDRAGTRKRRERPAGGPTGSPERPERPAGGPTGSPERPERPAGGRARTRERPAGGREGLELRAVGRAGVAVTGLFLFSTVDLFLARHHLRDGASGSYVAAATIAKTVLALPAGIMSAVFPRLLAAWPGPDRARALRTGALAVAGPALLGGAVVVAAPSLVLGLLYGDGYAGAAGLVRTLSTVAALTAVVTVLTNAALARRARTIAVPWVGAVLEVALIQLWHGSPAQVAACSAAALVPTLLLVAALEVRAWSRPTSQPGPGLADAPGTAETETTATEVTAPAR